MGEYAAYYLFAASTVYTATQQSKARKAEARRQEAQNRIAALKQQREARNALRKSRIAKAQAQAEAVSSGTTPGAISSGAAGAVGSIESQYAYNLSFLDKAGAYNTQAQVFGQQAADYRGKAEVGKAISNTASVFKN